MRPLPNITFDGDALNLSIAVDNFMANLWYALAPEFNVFQLDTPYKVSKNVTLPKPVIQAISAWMEDTDG